MHENHLRGTHMNKNHYRRLLIMAMLSFISMYVLMYAMVDTFANAIPNFNQLYMAGLMTSPMIVIELSLMSAMYQNRRLNALIIAASVIVLIVFFVFIRRQTAISDQQFLRSMIPHHASALLMCEQASIQDAEIKQLCEDILTSQQSQIDQMRTKLRELEK